MNKQIEKRLRESFQNQEENKIFRGWVFAVALPIFSLFAVFFAVGWTWWMKIIILLISALFLWNGIDSIKSGRKNLEILK